MALKNKPRPSCYLCIKAALNHPLILASEHILHVAETANKQFVKMAFQRAAPHFFKCWLASSRHYVVSSFNKLLVFIPCQIYYRELASG